MPGFDYDLLVIGAGSGGVRAARIAAGHGAKVAIAEAYRVGGTCVIRGCVPKKLLVMASRFADGFRDAAGFGWKLGAAEFSWPDLIAAKDREIARLEAAYAANLQRSGVTLFSQRASFVDKHTVGFDDGQRRTAAKILIATGGQPQRPTFPGAERVITSDQVFHRPALPSRLMILGGGYIAVEFACLLQRLGAAVTLAYRGDAVLRGFDGDIRRHLTEAMAAAGIEVLTRADAVRIEAAPNGHRVVLSNGETREVGEVLAAVGRNPNTAGLNLKDVGVEVNAAGAVIVDDRSQTTTDNIWAVGDVTNRLNLTPVAIREGHAFADSVFGKTTWSADHKDVATAIFTTPEIGTVGLSEEMAKALHTDQAVDIYKTSFRPMKATLSGSLESMFMKLVVLRPSDQILGAHVMGEGAGEMAQFLGILLKAGVTKAQFDATMPVHPTAAEEFVTLREKAG